MRNSREGGKRSTWISSVPESRFPSEKDEVRIRGKVCSREGSRFSIHGHGVVSTCHIHSVTTCCRLIGVPQDRRWYPNLQHLRCGLMRSHGSPSGLHPHGDVLVRRGEKTEGPGPATEAEIESCSCSPGARLLPAKPSGWRRRKGRQREWHLGFGLMGLRNMCCFMSPTLSTSSQQPLEILICI